MSPPSTVLPSNAPIRHPLNYATLEQGGNSLNVPARPASRTEHQGLPSISDFVASVSGPNAPPVSESLAVGSWRSRADWRTYQKLSILSFDNPTAFAFTLPFLGKSSARYLSKILPGISSWSLLTPVSVENSRSEGLRVPSFLFSFLFPIVHYSSFSSTSLDYT
jgi:hypothetical protein